MDNPKLEFMGCINLDANAVRDRMVMLLQNTGINLANNPVNELQEQLIEYGRDIFMNEKSLKNFETQHGHELKLDDMASVASSFLYFWAIQSLIMDQKKTELN